jgi:hypothetical protein
VVNIGNDRRNPETFQNSFTGYDMQNFVWERLFVSFMDNIVSRGFYSNDFFEEDNENHFGTLSTRDEYINSDKTKKGLYEILIELQELQKKCAAKEYAKREKRRYEFYDGYRDCYFVENPITKSELIEIRKMLFHFLFTKILAKYHVVSNDDIDYLLNNATIDSNNRLVRQGKIVSDTDLFDFSVFEKHHPKHKEFKSVFVKYVKNVIKLKVQQYSLKDIIMENDIIKKSSEHVLFNKSN